MGVEIERKFLVDATSWNNSLKGEGVHIKQGYLLKSTEKTVRVRIKGDQGFITVKGKTTNHISRAEFEYAIPFNDAEQMLEQFCTQFIEKVRYEVKHNGWTWEVDEFIHPRKGLLLAELELPSEDTSFDIPEWVTEEVSQDPQYFNANMLE